MLSQMLELDARVKKEGLCPGADKGKKSRFRQLTDLVKTGMSAVTSRANSRTPSRGPTQDLEPFEPVSRQGTQGLLGALPHSQGSQDLGSKMGLKSALAAGASKEGLQGRRRSGPIAEGYLGLPYQSTTNNASLSKMFLLSLSAPRCDARNYCGPGSEQNQALALSELSSDSFDKADSDDAMSIFLDAVAAQPSRSASSAALRHHWPVSHDHQTASLQGKPSQVDAHPSHFMKITGMPVAEGTESKQKPKPILKARSIPKGGVGFMSGASTGRGAVAQVPTAVAAEAAEQAEEGPSSHDEGQLDMLPGALPDVGLSLPGYAATSL